jgi:hypothetical protein
MADVAGTDTVEISVRVRDEQDAAQLRTEMAGITGDEPFLIERRGIDGASTAALILLATTTVQALPQLLDAITRFVRRNSVDEVELTEHGIRIVSPRPEDIDDLRARLGGDRARIDRDHHQ